MSHDTLQNAGYNVLSLPVADFRPLEVLARVEGKVTRLGSLDRIVRASTALPSPTPPTPLAAVDGSRTREVNVGFGAVLLRGFLRVFGVGGDVDVRVAGSESLAFEYRALERQAVEVIDVADYLVDAMPRTEHALLAPLFDTSGAVFVVTEVLTSNGFSVVERNGVEVAASAELTAPAGAEAAAHAHNRAGAHTDMSWDSDQRLAVAFRCIAMAAAGDTIALDLGAGAALSFSTDIVGATLAEDFLELS